MKTFDLGTDNLYYIGGVVRDEILGIPCVDIDIVYEGDAIEYCSKLKKSSTGKIVQINEEFGTVRMKKGAYNLDIASTRNEVYPKAGHLPVVTELGCELKKDVLRRDFTINAIAKSFKTGEIIDYVHGVRDIKNKTLRVLHNKSFVEDPTRIIRGLKFAVRFGFKLDDKTRYLQEMYICDVNYDMSYQRLKKELIDTFKLNSQEVYEKFFYFRMYRLISEEEPEFYSCNIQQLIEKYPVKHTWLVYLGWLNLENIPLTREEQKIITDYKNLSQLYISNDDLMIYRTFKDVATESILLYTITTNSNLGLKYLKLKDIKLRINGDDLIKMGYKPSAYFEKCFEYVLVRKFKNKRMTKPQEKALAREFFNHIK